MYPNQTNSNSPYGATQDVIAEELFRAQPVYAGFWLRFAAYMLDVFIVYFAAFLLAMVFGISNVFDFTADYASAGEFIFLFLYFAVLLYFPICESSSWQATLGKRAVGIKVTDLEGNRISFGKALGRFFGKIVSALILYIGFMMAGWTEKKQALHDSMASTLVVKA